MTEEEQFEQYLDQRNPCSDTSPDQFQQVMVPNECTPVARAVHQIKVAWWRFHDWLFPILFPRQAADLNWCRRRLRERQQRIDELLGALKAGAR